MVDLVRREAEALVVEAMSGFRVVVVNGPRQAGKSTLLDIVRGPLGAELFTLDDRTVLRAARTDPSGFVESLAAPAFLDEVQRGGDPLVLAIKAAVDRRPGEPGSFVLAGSSRFLTIPTLSESLAGRARIVDLWPFSQSELEGVQSGLIDGLFGGLEPMDLEPVAEGRADTMERLVVGGFPPAVNMATERLRRAWFEDYRRTMIQRDMRELSAVRQIDEVPRLLRLVAARSGQELNVASLGRDAGLAAETLRSYLALLETIYLFVQIPAWSTNRTSRAKKRPKVHIVDSGMAADLNGLSVDVLSDPLTSQAGPMLESFVVNEVIRLASWSDLRVGLFHFRDRDGREVDLILEAPDGRIVGIEVKAAVDVDEQDFRWLAYLRDRHSDRFVQGLVLHHGSRPMSFGDRLTAAPVSTLWTGT